MSATAVSTTTTSPTSKKNEPSPMKTRSMTGNTPPPPINFQQQQLQQQQIQKSPTKSSISNSNSPGKSPVKVGRQMTQTISKRQSPMKLNNNSNTSSPTKQSPKHSILSPQTPSPSKSPTKTSPRSTTTPVSPTTSPNEPTIVTRKRKVSSMSTPIPFNANPNNTSNNSPKKSWPKKSIIDWKIPEAPVFYPTVEEFKSPLKYIESIRPIAEKYGICKIIPPFKSTSHQKNINPSEFKFKTKVQNIHQLKTRWDGPSELFASTLFDYLGKRGRETTSIPVYDGRDLDFYSLFLEVNKRGGVQQCTQSNLWQDILKALKITDFCNKPIQTLKHYYHEYLSDFEIDKRKEFMKTHSITSSKFDDIQFVNEIIFEYSNPNNIHPDHDQDENLQDQDDREEELEQPQKKTGKHDKKLQEVPQQSMEKETDDKMDIDDKLNIAPLVSSPSLKSSSNSTLSSSNSSINQNQILDDDEDKDFQDFGFYEGNIYSLQEFEILANNFSKKWFEEGTNDPNSVENEFWRIVENGDESVQVHYGSDLDVTGATHGSGFSRDFQKKKPDYTKEHWNLNEMPKMDGSLFSHLTDPISGVTDPMMYVGMLFSAFCWHNEDNYLYSINYLHCGTYKTWYGVPGASAELFEKVMKSCLPELFSKNPDLLYLLITMVSPDTLRRHKVPVYKTLQAPGEYVITFPQAYHAGFSQGFTMAEAVNFAPADWIPYGSSSIERYQKTNRSSVFSHEQLLLTIANRSPTVELCAWLSKEFQRIKIKEQTLRNDITHEFKDKPELLNIEYPSTQLSDLLSKEPLQCDFCKYDCFYSYLQCNNCMSSINGDQHQRVSCLAHYHDICECPMENKKLVVLCSIEDIEKTIQQINKILHSPPVIKSDQTSPNKDQNNSTSSNVSTPITRSHAPKPVHIFPSPSSNDLSSTPPHNLIFSKPRKNLKISHPNANSYVK